MIDKNSLPDYLKLNGGSYRLIVRDLSNEGVWGYIDFEKRELHMNESLLSNPELFWQVLFHEVTHEALMTTGLSSLLMENELMLEENICDSVGFRMAEFVAKNPAIVESMRSGEKKMRRVLFESSQE